MEIVLMRHGRPVVPRCGWLPASAMRGWIAGYDAAVIAADEVSADALLAARAARHIATSTLPRALSTVSALGIEAGLVDSAFCEAQLPYASWTTLRLPVPVWALLFRVLWLLGYSHGAESAQSARLRARAAAAQLIALAASGPVLLVGHGIMNRLIARELRSLGWEPSTKHRSGHWSTSGYRLDI